MQLQHYAAYTCIYTMLFTLVLSSFRVSRFLCAKEREVLKLDFQFTESHTGYFTKRAKNVNKTSMYNLQKNRTHILFKCFKNLLVTCVQLLKSKWIIFFNPTKQTECEANMITTVQEKSIKKKIDVSCKSP